MGATYEPLSETRIYSLLAPATKSWVRELRVHQRIDSTNSHLVARAASGSVDGVVCLAELQTKGRGRRGRTWVTPEGMGIALSVGRQLNLPIAGISPLSLVVGVSAVAAMKSIGIEGIALKWPNDLLLGGLKVGGILIELAGASSPLIVVIGVGLNVGAGAVVQQRLGTAVGDLQDDHREISRNKLAAALIDNLLEATQRFETEGFRRLREEWTRIHYHQNRPVVLVTADDAIEGIALGVDMNGELLLETPSGITHFNAGEVSLRDEKTNG